MADFKNKVEDFMRGRNGADELGIATLELAVILAIVNIFANNAPDCLCRVQDGVKGRQPPAQGEHGVRIEAGSRAPVDHEPGGSAAERPHLQARDVPQLPPARPRPQGQGPHPRDVPALQAEV